MCYAVKAPSHAALPTGVSVADEFGGAQLNGIKYEELCVPSLIGDAGGS
jgi:hypothetical protein